MSKYKYLHAIADEYSSDGLDALDEAEIDFYTANEGGTEDSWSGEYSDRDQDRMAGGYFHDWMDRIAN